MASLCSYIFPKIKSYKYEGLNALYYIAGIVIAFDKKYSQISHNRSIGQN